MKSLLQRSLKFRVTLFTLAIFVLSLWALAYYASRMLREDMERLLGEQQFSTASLVATHVNQELEERILALEKVAASIGESEMESPQAVQTILGKWPILALLFNAGCYVTDAEATAIASLPVELNRVGLNFMFRKHVAAALREGRATVSDIVIGKRLQVPVLSMAAPIRNRQGRVIGSLSGVVNLDEANFLERITAIPYGKTGGYLIVEPEQRLIVVGTDRQRAMEKQPPPGVNPKMDRFMAGAEGSDVLVNQKGVEVLVAVKGIPAAGWSVVTWLPTIEAFAPVRDMQQRMLLTTIFLTLLVGGLIRWMLRRQLAPMTEAASTLAALTDENLSSQKLPVTTQDEIGELIGGFNRLLETLRQREDALQQSEARLSAIIETEPECIKIVDAEGHLRQMNPAGLAMIEADSLAQVAGRPVLDLIAPEYRAEFEQLHERVIAGESVQLQFEVIGLKGGRRWLETHAVPMLINGEIVHLAITRDIEGRKEADAELEKYRLHLEGLVNERTMDLSVAKEAAEAASRAKSTFLANMSHELRTPMNAIMGMTGVLLRHATEPKQCEQLGKIDVASRHLLAVINDILDISKIEADRLVLEESDFILGEVLENLTSMIGEKAREKGLALHFDLPPEVARLALRGDPLRLGQILLNYTSNAVKFTEQGSITVRIRQVKDRPESVVLHIEVTDTGIGISSEDQLRLYTAFEQADSSMTRKYGGTGLGLAISKRLVKLMGGEVGVVSQPGLGSTFWFSVCLGKADVAVSPVSTLSRQTAEQRLHSVYAGSRVLLVEDEPINQEVSREMLVDVGLVVDLADDGAIAVELARQHRYALILMDMQMPNLNGVDATRAIRAESLNMDTPILAMTANAFDEDRLVCIEAGMNDHIGKPVDPGRLFETLLNWLAKSRV
jgi:PAS domain S-box-containing protein